MEEPKEQKGLSPEQLKLAKHINHLLTTSAGQALWTALFHACGYNVSSLRFNRDGAVDRLSTECYEAQRKIYLDLRRLADPELRAEVERLAEAPSVETDTPTIAPAAQLKKAPKKGK